MNDCLFFLAYTSHTEGEDYIGLVTNVTFPAGSQPGTQASAAITIIDDALQEEDEFIPVVALIDDSSRFRPGLVGAASVILIDDDSKFNFEPCM